MNISKLGKRQSISMLAAFISLCACSDAGSVRVTRQAENPGSGRLNSGAIAESALPDNVDRSAANCCNSPQLVQRTHKIGDTSAPFGGEAPFRLFSTLDDAADVISLGESELLSLKLEVSSFNHASVTVAPIRRKNFAANARRIDTSAVFPAVCFAPGTPKATMAAFYAAHQRPDLDLYRLGTRWGATATSGGGLQQGDPTVITWSFIPDGTIIPGGANGAGEPSAPSNLIAFLNGIYGSQAVWQALYQQMFDRWSDLTGLTYVYQPTDDGAAFPGSGGALGVRGDVRIGGHFIDGNSGILAYNFFPNTGDMVIDTADNFYSDTSNSSLRLRNVLSHEHGHGIGLFHTCPTNNTKLMEPFINLNFDGPQHDDRLGGMRGYGDSAENNNTAPTATSLGLTLANGTYSVQDVSIDDNLDVDFFSFTVAPGNKSAAVTITPVGFTYLEGPQNNDGSCSAGTLFNSLIITNLGVQLLDTNGVTVLGTANLNAAGVAEVIPTTPLPSGSGPYYVRVFGNGVDNAQLYSVGLTLSNTPNTTVIQAFSSTLLAENCPPANSAVDPGETVTFNFALRNIGALPSTNLVATLQVSGGVAAPSSPKNYGALVGGASATRAFTFTATGICGATLTATLQLQDGASNLGTVSFPFVLGTTSATTTSFTNAGAISIPDSGTASPYPSPRVVSGVTGTVTKVTARLNSLTHTFPADFDVLLTGPAGQKVMLMSAAGGGFPVSNVTLTFDDSAGSGLPSGSTITTGTYTPSSFSSNTLPAPAPIGPYGSLLSAYNGLNPNGTWSLFINDTAAGDLGTVAGGFTLGITTALPACCTAPLLQVTGVVSRKPHGGAGTFDIALPLAGGGIECRTGPAYSLVFAFSSNIASASGVTVTGASGVPTANISSISGNEIAVSLAGVNDVQPLEVTLNGVTDVNGATLIPVLRFKVLHGDVNAGSSVNVSDINLVKAGASPGTVDGTNFRRDLNASGTINISDVNIAKSKSGNSLP